MQNQAKCQNHSLEKNQCLCLEHKQKISFQKWNLNSSGKSFTIYNLPKKAAIGLIYFYQYTLSYFLGGHCRFYPSCSEYALNCYKDLNFFKASWIVLKRILKCHPFSGQQGYDPAPIQYKGKI